MLERLYPEVGGIVDDNAELIEYLTEDYKGTIYLYNNVPGEKEGDGIVACPTWEDVIAEIKKRVRT